MSRVDKELLQLWVERELQSLLRDAVQHDRLFHKDKILANLERFHYRPDTSRQDWERVRYSSRAHWRP
jgi:hypothetical protein